MSPFAHPWRFARFATCAALLLGGCDASHEEEGDAHAEPGHPALSWDELAFGCSVMGEGEQAHVMCNHGHALNLRNENLWERWRMLQSKGVAQPNEAQLMHGGQSHDPLPPPLTPILRARLGERVRIRAASYGPQFHTFHVHGHLWKDGANAADTQTLGPAEVYDLAEFYAGAGIDDPKERAGVGDWMYHCHVETHAVTGMWGIFRVLPKEGAAEQPGADGRFAYEVPPPLGGPGQKVTVHVVAAEVPLVVARSFVPAKGELVDVVRKARLYIPMPDEASWQAATAAELTARFQAGEKSTHTAWILSLRKGTEVTVKLRNLIPDAPASLHPHGVAYKVESDGTMEVSMALPGGKPTVSTWTADTVGTWPLHDHARQVENIGRGLFSAIVVKDDAEIAAIQRDYLVIFHDYDMDWMMGSATPVGGGH